jgi:cytochrome c oxidase subunit II
VGGETCLTVRDVLRERRAHCIEGALLAACAFWVHGEAPLLLDMRAVNDFDHVVALYRREGLWGAISKTNGVFLRSRDVIHNFKVPNFRAKMDALPGQMSRFWFTPTELGEYQAICAQLCGMAHFAMRATVRVVGRVEFESWLMQQPTFAQLQLRGNADIAAGEARFQGCVACHGTEGQGDPDMDAPKLAGLDPWYLERQLRLFRDGGRGVHEADVTGHNMAPFGRVLDDETIRNLAAYIADLPDRVAEPMVTGNAERGQRLYRTCAHCHGVFGQGNWATNAPRLAGQSDWYLARQLENFREGIRGRHGADRYGNQMVDMAQFLVTEREIRDVVTYINTLPLPVPEDTGAHAEHAATGERP